MTTDTSYRSTWVREDWADKRYLEQWQRTEPRWRRTIGWLLLPVAMALVLATLVLSSGAAR